MNCLKKKRKKGFVVRDVKTILPKFLIFLLLVFSLCSLGFVTSENIDNSLENSKGQMFFGIKIIDFESPMELGKFFGFTYSVKGISDTNEDIEISFWIEKQGEIITSGSDTIFIGDFEEKIETTKIFLPKNVESGVYDFFVKVVCGNDEAESHRTIEIEIQKGMARIATAEGKVLNTYVISFLVGLAIFILSLIFYLERRKIKKQFRQGERWIKKYKLFVLALFLFIILGTLIYYLDFLGGMVKGISEAILALRTSASLFYFILGIIFIFVVLIILIKIVRKKKLFKKLKKEKVLEKKYKSTVKESKIKFKKISKVQNKILKRLALFFKTINPLKLVRFLLNFLKKKTILFVKLIKKIKIKKIKVKKKKKVKKVKKPIKIKKKKIKKKKVKIKPFFSKYNPFKHIKRFFKKITSNLKKLKIKFPKKPKKKVKLVTVKKVHEKQKKLEIPKKSKSKKFLIKVRRIAKALGVIIKKLSRCLKSKFKLFSKFISKKGNYITKEEKRALKNDKKAIKKVYKSIFKLLKKLFGKKPREKIIRDFEKTFVKTGKFTQKHLQILKDVLSTKLKFGTRQLKKEFKEDRLNFHKTINELRKNAKNLIDDLIKHSKEHKKIILKEKKERRIKTKIRMRKLSNFFKKKSKASETFVSNKSKQISKQEKNIAKKAKKDLKKAYKNIFKLLKKIFGKKSQKKIVRGFEKSVRETKKFSEQSLTTLKNLLYRKKEIKRKKLDFSKVNELRKNAKNLISELTEHVNNLISHKKKNLKHKNQNWTDASTPNDE
ncbi:hypothetical protein KAR52_01445 [Candidatus Pacearchaeota archaeon]|nr:hypothetical protein [Candidatus Pacearchaeota archaeon]